jgi:hypothetical protein
MELCGHRARPGELDPELLWLAISCGGVLAAGLWLAAGLPWPHCLFLALTGHPCLTCGATRGAIELLHGHLYNAWRWNPLMFVVFCGVALFDAYALVVLVTGAPRLRISAATASEKNFIRLLLVAMLALNWLYLLLHSNRYV